MRKTKIAVVGLGHAANDFHLPVLTKFDDVEVILCEAWEDRRVESGKRWGIPSERWYADLSTMLREADPDGVYILLPQYTWRGRPPVPHTEYVLETLAAGKPVFVEKPLATTAEVARQLATAAHNNSVVTTQCGFQRRFNPLLRHCVERVRECGPLLNCSFHFFKGEGPQTADTGVILDNDWLTLDMIHCLDLMRSIPDGRMVEFTSSTGMAPGDLMPTAFHAMARFDSGTTSFFTSNVRAGGRVLRFELHGVGLSAFIETDPRGAHHDSMVASIVSNGAEEKLKEPQIVCSADVAVNDSSQAHAGFWQEDRHFVDCVRAGCRTDCDFDDALQSSELCERILVQSLESTAGNSTLVLG